MTLSDIIAKANLAADEEYGEHEVLPFIEAAINKFNTYWPALVETPEDVTKIDGLADLTNVIQFTEKVVFTPYQNPSHPTAAELKVRSDEEFKAKQLNKINNIYNSRLIVQYVTYMIKVNDGSKSEYEDRLNEWEKDLRKIKATYGKYLAPENRLDSLEPSQNRRNHSVAIKNPLNNPYGNANTFGRSPSGNSSSSSDYRQGLVGFKVK